MIIIKNQHACLWLDQLNSFFGVIISFMNILLTSYQSGPTAFLISLLVWALYIENVLTLTSYWKHFPILIFTQNLMCTEFFIFIGANLLAFYAVISSVISKLRISSPLYNFYKQISIFSLNVSIVRILSIYLLNQSRIYLGMWNAARNQFSIYISRHLSQHHLLNNSSLPNDLICFFIA